MPGFGSEGKHFVSGNSPFFGRRGMNKKLWTGGLAAPRLACK